MKAEVIKELLLSGKYDCMSVKDFAHAVIELEADEVEAEKLLADVGKMVEEEKYAKQVQRANDILDESYEKEDAFSDDVYDKASSNRGELI